MTEKSRPFPKTSDSLAEEGYLAGQRDDFLTDMETRHGFRVVVPGNQWYPEQVRTLLQSCLKLYVPDISHLNF